MISVFEVVASALLKSGRWAQIITWSVKPDLNRFAHYYLSRVAAAPLCVLIIIIIDPADLVSCE